MTHLCAMMQQRQTIDQWCVDMTLVCALKPDADAYIREQADKARRERWSRKCRTTQNILNLLFDARHPQTLLLQTYENLRVAGGWFDGVKE
jgi:predicted transcriptional regulator